MADGYTPADVELVARAMAESHCYCRPETLCTSHTVEAEAAVSALAAAGRLLPADAQRFTDYAWRADDAEPVDADDEEAARWFIDEGFGGEVVQREAMRWYGPWLPVPNPETKETT